MKISFGILSGPRLLFLLSLFIVYSISFSVIGLSLFSLLYSSLSFFMVSVICLVDSSYSGVPGLARYRSFKIVCYVFFGFLWVCYFSSIFSY